MRAKARVSPRSTCVEASGGGNRRHHRRRRRRARIAIAADVTRPRDVEAAVAAAMARFRPHRHPAQQCRRRDRLAARGTRRRAQFQRGARPQSRLGLPHRRRRCCRISSSAGRRRIINISSLAAIRWTGYPYFAYYAAKAAVNQATVALALQYAPQGIRANCIMPGMIDTPLIYAQIAATTPRSRRWSRRATARCRWAGWARPGTSRTPRSSSPPTRRSSSPASACRSMAARAAPCRFLSPAEGRQGLSSTFVLN